MAEGKILSIQSFRGGTGKTNIAGNLAALAAGAGRCIGILDADFQSPGLHLVMDLPGEKIHYTLIDHLQDKCCLTDSAYDVTHRVCGNGTSGKCWLLPASPDARSITEIVNEGYDANRLAGILDRVIEELKLDCLIIDTHPGLNRETMLTTALSDNLILLLRPDQQDYQGTALYLEIARRLEIPSIRLMMNKLYSHIDAHQLRERVEKSFECTVVAMLPLSEDVARNESKGLFCRSNPDHPVTMILKNAAHSLFLENEEAPAPGSGRS